MIDANGDVLTNLRGVGGRKFNISDRKYFQLALRTGKPVISEPLRGAVSGKAIAVVIVPMIVDKQVRLLVAGGIDLDSQQLTAALYAGSDKSAGELMLVSGAGILISHPNPEFVMQPKEKVFNYENSYAYADRKGDGWWLAKNEHGVATVFSEVKLSSADWIVVGSYPYQTEFSALESVRQRVLVVVIMIVVAAGVLGFFLAYSFLKPLVLLRQSVGQLEDGILDREALRTSRNDEIGDLSNQFYRLVLAKDQHAEKANEQEVFVRSLLAGAPDAVILTNAKGEIQDWNIRAEAMFGWGREDAISKNIVQLILPDEPGIAQIMGLLNFSSQRGGGAVSNPIRLEARCKNGQPLMIELSVARISNTNTLSTLAFIRDVTTQIEREDRIALGERRLQMIADNVPALIAYVDRSRRYRFSNAHYLRVLGVDPAGMIGRQVVDVLGLEVYEQMQEWMELAYAGHKVHFEFSQTTSGLTKHFMADFIPDLEGPAESRGFYALVSDISERKGAELRQAASEQRADAANRAKSAFVANISHEIRTPMNAVLGVAQLLQKTPLQDEQKAYLEIIRSSGISLISILNNVLDLSKIEAGKMEFEKILVDIESLIESTVAILLASSMDKNIEVLVGISCEVPRFIVGDAVRIQQIITNLVSNAVKFTHDGYVSVSIRLGESPEVLEIVVDDSGIGMSKEQQQRVFDSFAQADSSTTRNYGGTGLGLAISQQLAVMMGGTISLTSAPSEGTRFVFKFPFEREDPNVLQETSEAVFLLIDESNHSRDLFVRTAAYCGYTAFAFSSVAEACSAAQYDLLRFEQITHVLLPSNIEPRLEVVKKQLFLSGVPSCSSLHLISSSFRDESPLIGGTYADILRKPLTPKLLRKIVNKLQTDFIPRELAHAHMAQLRILLVEDNDINQLIAKAMLANHIKELRIANNGKEAVDILRTAGNFFDLILMDVQMPVMDGYAATSIIRNDLKLTLPIIAMSAGVLSEDVDRCRAVGMSDFIAKPILMDDLYELLERVATQLSSSEGVVETRDSVSSDIPVVVFSSPMLHAILCKNPGMLDQIKQTVVDGITKAREDILKVKDAVSENNFEYAGRLLHSLCGGLGALGASEFVELAQALQMKLKRDIAIDTDELVPCLEVFAAAIEVWLEKPPLGPVRHARAGAKDT
ncbi:ATP-binding protein [Duganella flavida]|uniref:ATP-binding protein n=1 Tax=Duganella flavida TaxID=2692175 RepID=UPI001E4E524C|nr:ATP-binding protein [Duganella flavida]